MNRLIIILFCCAGLASAQLYFKTGYEPGTTQDAGLQNYSGIDNSTGFNWNVFTAGQVKGICSVGNQYWNCAQPGVDALAKIIDDPEGKHGKILLSATYDTQGRLLSRDEHRKSPAVLVTRTLVGE